MLTSGHVMSIRSRRRVKHSELPENHVGRKPLLGIRQHKFAAIAQPQHGHRPTIALLQNRIGSNVPPFHIQRKVLL